MPGCAHTEKRHCEAPGRRPPVSINQGERPQEEPTLQADTLSSDFQPPKLRESIYLLLKPSSLCFFGRSHPVSLQRASQMVRLVQNLLGNAGDTRDAGSIPGSGRSSGEGNGNLVRMDFVLFQSDFSPVLILQLMYSTSSATSIFQTVVWLLLCCIFNKYLLSNHYM